MWFDELKVFNASEDEYLVKLIKNSFFHRATPNHFNALSLDKRFTVRSSCDKSYCNYKKQVRCGLKSTPLIVYGVADVVSFTWETRLWIVLLGMGTMVLIWIKWDSLFSNEPADTLISGVCAQTITLTPIESSPTKGPLPWLMIHVFTSAL